MQGERHTQLWSCIGRNVRAIPVAPIIRVMSKGASFPIQTSIGLMEKNEGRNEVSVEVLTRGTSC
jgi:hypothetical protein